MDTTKPRQLTPLERAGVERTFRNEYLRLVKVGENEPFASLMATGPMPGSSTG